MPSSEFPPPAVELYTHTEFWRTKVIHAAIFCQCGQRFTAVRPLKDAATMEPFSCPRCNRAVFSVVAVADAVAELIQSNLTQALKN